jgi:hypothetical protein
MTGIVLTSRVASTRGATVPTIEAAENTAPLGLQARRLEAEARRRHAPSLRLVRMLGIRMLDLARILWYAPRLALKLRGECGISVGAQLRAQFRLAFRDGIDPSMYYFAELYKPGALKRIDQYFMRREVKGQLLCRLHRLQPPAAERRINLGDKLQFLAWCARTNLPHTEPLMLIEDGQVIWQTGNLLDLDQDLFVKPRTSRGARGVSHYRRTAAFRYEDQNGCSVTLGEIASALIRRFGTRNLVVLPRLRNHPELANLASESLITIRAVTCLNERQQPELTLAYLRVLAKLEPDWPVRKPISEYAAAIDLGSGRLSAMTGDKPECLSQWHDRHPITGVEVTGRLVPDWDAVAALAERAHRVTRDRVLVGWDIAITPSGPVLLEGNSYADVHYPQRIFLRPYGEMRIGQLLRHHMGRLEQKWAAEDRPT